MGRGLTDGLGLFLAKSSSSIGHRSVKRESSQFPAMDGAEDGGFEGTWLLWSGSGSGRGRGSSVWSPRSTWGTGREGGAHLGRGRGHGCRSYAGFGNESSGAAKTACVLRRRGRVVLCADSRCPSPGGLGCLLGDRGTTGEHVRGRSRTRGPVSGLVGRLRTTHCAG